MSSAICFNLEQCKILSSGNGLKQLKSFNRITIKLLNTQPFPERQILHSSKLKEFADDNSEFDENGRKFSIWVKKLCGKRRNCSLKAISPFPHSVFKRLVLQTRQNQGLFGKGLTHLLVTVGGATVRQQNIMFP